MDLIHPDPPDPGKKIFRWSPSSSSLNRPQISGLIAKEAPTKIRAKYSDFADVFVPDLASELPENTGINDHTIEQVNGCQQPPYGPIYSLGLVELKTLKAYIETNLANGFIGPSKSPTGAPILFKWKSDSSSGYASTIKTLTTSRSKTSTRYHQLGSR